MKDIKISVIVPMYNKEQKISKCLDSLINQTLREIEIVVVDDGSKDNSAEIVKNIAKRIREFATLNKIIKDQAQREM